MLKSILILLAFGISSAHASTLILASRKPGFEPSPQTKIFTLDDDGTMTLTIVDYNRVGLPTTQTLGKLDSPVMAQITSEISYISPTAKLIDLQAGQPQCTDTPTYQVSVTNPQTGLETKVSQKSGCHEWSLDSGDGRQSVELAMLFLNFL